jgi:glycosidase
MKKLSAFLMAVITSTVALAAGDIVKIERVEPLNWWVGMKHPLQVMFYDKNLSGSKVSINAADIVIKEVHNAESPNYLFVDVEVLPAAKAGTYIFTIEKNGKKIKQPYTLANRRAGSAEREGFSSKDVVYLLMPDRFAQGDSTIAHSLKGKVDRKDDFARHGGDIQGIINHLDYLADLGITALWSTPLTEDNEEKVSYHGYACSDYYKIDPRYGSNDLYKTMVDAAHQKGIKIIKDMVPNHCGAGHWWMKEPPFAQWINHYPKFVPSNNVQAAQIDPYASKAERDLHVRGWFVESMPDINLAHPYVLNYFSQMAIWWIEWANIDGLRVDTYPYSDKQAIAEWTRRIISEYPRFNIVGECWVTYPALSAYWQGSQPKYDGYASHLPSVMDFALQQAIGEMFKQDEVHNWYQGMMNFYFVLAQDFLYQNPNNILIFADNHDTDRLAHYTNGNADKQKLVITLMATMRGIPQLYYGTEQLLRGKSEHWLDGKRVDFLGGWASDTMNLFTGKGRTKAQDSVYRHTKKLLTWRKNVPAIHYGKTMQFFPSTPANIYAYARYTDNEVVFVIVNPNASKRDINLQTYAEVLAGYTEGIEIVSNNRMQTTDSFTLLPRQSIVLHCKK